MHVNRRKNQSIIMRKILLVFAVACFAMLAAHADDKLAPSTKMFLYQLRSGAFDVDNEVNPQFGAAGRRIPGVAPYKKDNGREMFVARPNEVDGVMTVNAFIELNGTSVAELEAKGVVIQSTFDGFVTAAIPVDKIEELAQLTSVKRIQVAQMMRVLTDSARSATRVDKVIDGLNNGLISNYDATGVIVGIVDTGIDPQHSAFDDANGATRIKRLYQVKGTQSWSGSVTYKEKFYTDTAKIVKAEPDTNNESHGTHTSTTAAGKRMKTKYGDFCGIAPNCDVYLCGLASLQDTYIANSVQKITAYADSVGKPCVISISLGGITGPHDGTDYICKVYNQATAKPGHILVLASANQAGSKMYAYKKDATVADPLATVYKQSVYSKAISGDYYYNGYSVAWAREKDVPLAARVLVLDARNDTIIKDFGQITANDMGIHDYKKISDIDSYYEPNYSMGSQGYMVVQISRDAVNKKESVMFRVYNLKSTASSYYGQNGYKLAYVVYPLDSAQKTDIDLWEGGYYGNFMGEQILPGSSSRGYATVVGNDKCSASSECYADGVITVGSYVSRNSFKGDNAKNGFSTGNTVGDISDFSSYVENNYGPEHKHTIPTIAAPGQTIIAGVNHKDVSNYGQTSGRNEEYQYITKTDATSRYGSMSGTSMATPCTAGIVALWLQANPKLTVEQVRTMMKETAIQDQYTKGANATHFGNGKINALGGFTGPAIAVTAAEIDFGTVIAGTTVEKKFAVRGQKIEKPITVTVKGASSAFSVTPAQITAAKAKTATGDSVTVKFKANATGEFSDTIVVACGDAPAEIKIVVRAKSNKIVPGDVNVDNKVDNADVSVLINYILGLDPKPFSKDNADLDQNGICNVTDVTMLINQILGIK